jgi:hypothetical protein
MLEQRKNLSLPANAYWTYTAIEIYFATETKGNLEF